MLIEMIVKRPNVKDKSEIMYKVYSALLLILSVNVGANDMIFSLYLGRYTDNSLVEEILVNKPIQFEPSNIITLALAKVYARPHPERQWEFESQLVKHYRRQTHWEFNALAIHRWRDYLWDRYLKTTFAIGGGLSHATKVPPLEFASHINEGAAKTLAYLMLEATFQAPQMTNLQFMVRIHHRSGVYKLINNVAGGSNHIGVGVKWLF